MLAHVPMQCFAHALMKSEELVRLRLRDGDKPVLPGWEHADLHAIIKAARHNFMASKVISGLLEAEDGTQYTGLGTGSHTGITRPST